MKILVIIIMVVFVSCASEPPIKSKQQEKSDINLVMDNWHRAAAEANYENYFNLMDSISVFIGTDATENWTKKEFEAFSKPYFNQGKAWSFKAVERNVYLNENQNFAWFDELLDTWMGICRGSGVLKKDNGIWKIKHYVLSVTIPNDDIQPVIDLKSEKDSLLLKRLKD